MPDIRIIKGRAYDMSKTIPFSKKPVTLRERMEKQKLQSLCYLYLGNIPMMISKLISRNNFIENLDKNFRQYHRFHSSDLTVDDYIIPED